MEPRPTVNLEDPVGKTVGKRKVPPQPFDVRHSNRGTALAWKKALPYRSPRREVYRFRSHEEADAWMTQMLGPLPMSMYE
jgi:hypothetical protein